MEKQELLGRLYQLGPFAFRDNSPLARLIADVDASPDEPEVADLQRDLARTRKALEESNRNANAVGRARDVFSKAMQELRVVLNLPNTLAVDIPAEVSSILRHRDQLVERAAADSANYARLRNEAGNTARLAANLQASLTKSEEDLARCRSYLEAEKENQETYRGHLVRVRNAIGDPNLDFHDLGAAVLGLVVNLAERQDDFATANDIKDSHTKNLNAVRDAIGNPNLSFHELGSAVGRLLLDRDSLRQALEQCQNDLQANCNAGTLFQDIGRAIGLTGSFNANDLPKLVANVLVESRAWPAKHAAAYKAITELDAIFGCCSPDKPGEVVEEIKRRHVEVAERSEARGELLHAAMRALEVPVPYDWETLAERIKALKAQAAEAKNGSMNVKVQPGQRMFMRGDGTFGPAPDARLDGYFGGPLKGPIISASAPRDCMDVVQPIEERLTAVELKLNSLADCLGDASDDIVTSSDNRAVENILGALAGHLSLAADAVLVPDEADSE